MSLAGEGPPGGSAFTCWALVRDFGSGTGAVFGQAGSISPTTGWVLGMPGSTTISMRVGNGSAVVASPAYTFGAADLNAWTVFHGVIDVAGGFVRLYRNGVQVGTGTAITAFAPASGVRTGIGCRHGGGNPFTRGAIGGAGAVDVVMTGAEIATHYAAIVAAGASVLPGVGTNTWNYATANAGPTWPYTGTGPNGILNEAGSVTKATYPLNWS